MEKKTNQDPKLSMMDTEVLEKKSFGTISPSEEAGPIMGGNANFLNAGNGINLGAPSNQDIIAEDREENRLHYEGNLGQQAYQLPTGANFTLNDLMPAIEDLSYNELKELKSKLPELMDEKAEWIDQQDDILSKRTINTLKSKNLVSRESFIAFLDIGYPLEEVNGLGKKGIRQVRDLEHKIRRG